jgi:hypothetical protein
MPLPPTIDRAARAARAARRRRAAGEQPRAVRIAGSESRIDRSRLVSRALASLAAGSFWRAQRAGLRERVRAKRSAWHALRRHAVLIGLLVVVARGGKAAADPATDRVFTAPTAWLPAPGAVIGAGSVDLRAIADGRAETNVMLGVGLGDLAALEISNDTDVRGCDDCGDQAVTPINIGRATFRLGARQDAWFPGMPAVVVGARKSFLTSGSFRRARVAEGYLVASRAIGPLRMHAGVTVLDAGFSGDADDTGLRPERTLGATVRPLGGFEWTPSQYPRTSLMADITYVPRFERAGSDERVELEWVAGWGARYQAFAWGAIELAVRHRQDEGLGDSTVMMRVSGVLGGTPTGKAPAARR